MDHKANQTAAGATQAGVPRGDRERAPVWRGRAEGMLEGGRGWKGGPRPTTVRVGGGGRADTWLEGHHTNVVHPHNRGEGCFAALWCSFFIGSPFFPVFDPPGGLFFIPVH